MSASFKDDNTVSLKSSSRNLALKLSMTAARWGFPRAMYCRSIW
jgi:hypothetical protein